MKWIFSECGRHENVVAQGIFVSSSTFLFPSALDPCFGQFIANVGYRPNDDFGNLGLEGGLSTLESVVYACPGCAGAPKL